MSFELVTTRSFLNTSLPKTSHSDVVHFIFFKLQSVAENTLMNKTLLWVISRKHTVFMLQLFRKQTANLRPLKYRDSNGLYITVPLFTQFAYTVFVSRLVNQFTKMRKEHTRLYSATYKNKMTVFSDTKINHCLISSGIGTITLQKAY